MNVYEIATKISMVNGVSAVLAVISKEVLNLEGGIKNLTKAFGTLNSTSLLAGGGLAMLAGGGILLGLKKVTDQAKELSHQLVQLQQLNMPKIEFERIKSAAFALHSQVPGTTSVDAIKIGAATWSMFGTEGVLKILKPLAEFAQVTGNRTGDFQGAADKVYEMTRSADLMGKFVDTVTHKVDITKFLNFLDLAGRVSAATHGRVNESTWMQMAQQGGPALSNMSDEGLLSIAMAAQGMTGFKAGTAMTSLYQQMIGGKMMKYAADELISLGLLKNDYKLTKGGHIVWGKGALDTPFTQALQKDPLAASEMMRKAMEKGGFTTIETQVPELFKMLGRQTTQRLVHDFLRNFPQMLSERPRIEGGMGIHQAAMLANEKDYEKNIQNLDAAFHEMMMHIASPLTQAVIPIMKQISTVFDSIGEFAKANPGAIGEIAKALAMIGAGLFTAGILAIAIGIGGLLGPAGAVILGITALYGVCKVIAALSWDVLGPGMKTFAAAVVSIANIGWDVLMVGLKGLLGFIQTLKDMVGSLFGKTSFEGGGGGGASIHKASWGGAAGAGDRFAAAGGRGQYAGLIKSLGGPYASDLLKIYGTEGARGYVGDHGTSFGPFQFHYGGGSIGDIFTGKTGLDARNPSTVPAQIEFMKRWGAEHGKYSSDIWHGLRDQGIGSLPAPRIAPYHKPSPPTIIENTMYLDGDVVHRSTVRRMVDHAMHPTTAPLHDGMRHWTPADSGLVHA